MKKRKSKKRIKRIWNNYNRKLSDLKIADVQKQKLLVLFFQRLMNDV
jgi:hypothetical protein